MKKVYSYLRVSTDHQAERGVSLEAQESKIQQYATLYNMNISEIVHDSGYSAKSLMRPGIQKILEGVRKGEVQAVIVAKLDRLTRSVRDLADLVDLFNKRGVSLVSVGEHIDTGSAAGRMVLNMLGTISQWERETIGERTSSAIQFKKSTGLAYSGRQAPYGFRKECGRLIPDEAEQAIVDTITQLRAKHSLSGICRELEAQGIQTRNGGAWHHKVVAGILQNSADREQGEQIKAA